jgi:hypothetical protein
MPDNLIPTSPEDNPQLVAELRSFLEKRKERTPQEAIGMEKSGGLLSGLLVSTIGFLAVLGLMTAIPFFFGSDEPLAKKTPSPAPAANNELQPEASQGTLTGNNLPDSVANPDEVLGRLNMGETKPADLTLNPLDDPKFDSLLDPDN